MRTGDLKVTGSIWAEHITARSVEADRGINVDRGIIAKTRIISGRGLLSPTNAWLLVTDEGGTLSADILETGNVVTDQVKISGRASLFGGILEAKNVEVGGKLHHGRGREGQVTGAVVENMKAQEIECDTSIIVKRHAEFGPLVFVMGDLAAKSLRVVTACNIAVRGSLIAEMLQTSGTVTAAFDCRRRGYGEPALMLGESEVEKLSLRGSRLKPYDPDFAKRAASVIAQPLCDFVAGYIATCPVADPVSGITSGSQSFSSDLTNQPAAIDADLAP